MLTSPLRISSRVLVLLLALAVVTAAPTPNVASAAQDSDALVAPATTATEGPSPEFLLALAQLKTAAPLERAHRVELGPIDLPAELRRTPTKGSPLRVGTVRPLPAAARAALSPSALPWEPAPDGGLSAVFIVRSPEARTVRAALRFDSVPDGIELRFFDPNDPTRAEGPFGRAALIDADWGDEPIPAAGYPFWSSPFEGDGVGVEIWLPTRAAVRELQFEVHRVSHAWNNPMAPARLSELGASQACERDQMCFKAWEFMANAVAKYVFNDGTYEYLCTGTVMNDKDDSSFIPYFMTAAHCVSTAAEANTMAFYWKFKRAVCNGANPTSVMRTTGGARLHYTTGAVGMNNDSTDHTFLELKQTPPLPYSLSGWSARDGKENKKKIAYGLHHPSGDVMKAGKAKILALKKLTGDAQGNLFVSNKAPLNMYQVKWKKGVTEGGSSGSGLFLNNKEQWFIGVLTGGASSCSSKKSPDYYGRFDRAWNKSKKIRQLLGGQ